MPTRVQYPTVLVLSASPQRSDSVARFLEWEFPLIRILAAPTPETAVRFALREKVGLVIVDGGVSVSAELDAHEATRKAPRIYIGDDSSTVTGTDAAGPRDAPPLDYGRLLQEVRRSFSNGP